MAHIPWPLSRPIKSLELHYTMIQFLIIGVKQRATSLPDPSETQKQLFFCKNLIVSLFIAFPGPLQPVYQNRLRLRWIVHIRLQKSLCV